MTVALRLALCVFIAVAIFVILLYSQQEKMIYKPRAYRPDHLERLPDSAVKLEYEINCGKQSSWYVPPRNGTDPKALPETLWIYFGGNGSLGLSWLHVIKYSPDAGAGHLMFDYPGYGNCQGKPSPKTMAVSGDALLVALAGHLDVPLEKLKARTIRLMGHSLGSGVALEFAERHEVDRLVLVSPFTSTRSMADLVVSPYLGWLITHHLDNRKALDTLADRDPQPRIIITHGTADTVVPVEMGRELKALYPDMIDYVEIAGADHGNILDEVELYELPDLPDQVSSLDDVRYAANGNTMTAASEPLAPADNSN